jgi:hypothetical protein
MLHSAANLLPLYNAQRRTAEHNFLFSNVYSPPPLRSKTLLLNSTRMQAEYSGAGPSPKLQPAAGCSALAVTSPSFIKD